jgi:single-strand DNA-binding protein
LAFLQTFILYRKGNFGLEKGLILLFCDFVKNRRNRYDGEKGGEIMNHVGLVGRLTKDPVLREFAENRVATSFVVAVNRNYRNHQGDVDADFVLCTAWGKLAERIVQYCGKGSLIGVNGRLQSRSYINKENFKVFSTEVVADEVRFYLLKSPTNKQSEVEKDFVLPETEEGLPVT